MTTTTYENLKAEAAKHIEGLGATVRALEKQVASVSDRILFERGDILRREGNLSRFQDTAAAKLETSTARYLEWQGRHRKLTVDLATARDGLALLETKILPKVKSDLAVARAKLSQALATLCLAGRAGCGARMAVLLDAVIAEHDEYFLACKQLHADYSLGYTTPGYDSGIVVEHARIRNGQKLLNTSTMRYLSFTDPRVPEEAPPVDVDTQAVQGPDKDAQGDDRTEKGVQGATDAEIVAPAPAPAPLEAPLDAPEAAAAPESDEREEMVQGATERGEAAPEAPPEALPKKRATLLGNY